MAHSRDRSKERRWVGLLQAKQASGESTAAFCRQRRISVHQFHWWQRELRRRGAEVADESRSMPGAFVPVRIPLATPLIEVVHPGGCIIRVAAGIDIQSLRNVLTALESQEV